MRYYCTKTISFIQMLFRYKSADRKVLFQASGKDLLLFVLCVIVLAGLYVLLTMYVFYFMYYNYVVFAPFLEGGRYSFMAILYLFGLVILTVLTCKSFSL